MQGKLVIVLAGAGATIFFCACNRQSPVSQRASAPTPAVQNTAPAPSTDPVPKPPEAGASPAAAEITAGKTTREGRESETQLAVGQETFHFVKHTYECPPPSKDQTVQWWELRDTANKVVYRQEYKTDAKCDETTDVGAQALNGQQGHGILIDGEDTPSAPDSGGWVQVFGMQNGKLVPFGKSFSADSGFLKFTTQSTSGRGVGGGTVTVTKDVLTFKEWTGNFHMIYALGIDWASGTVSPAWHCLSTNSQGIMVDGCSCPVEVRPLPRKEITFVRLYTEPDAGFSPKHVVVKPDSKLEFLEAVEPVPWQGLTTTPTANNDSAPNVWLKIRVEGQEGWIHDQEDFQAVGLPFAG